MEKLLACGHNGCVYKHKDTIIKKSNGALNKKEIEFMEWFNSLGKVKLRLNLIPLLDYSNKQGCVFIPYPPNFEDWEDKYKIKWINMNRKSDKHNELVYPLLKYTLFDKYWLITKKTRYEIAISFLQTIKIMDRYKFYNGDIHSRNIMYGDKWYMIDYGAISNRTSDLEWSVLYLLLTMSCIPEYSVYPDNNKPKYDNLKIVNQLLKKLDTYKKFYNLYKEHSNIKKRLALEALWIVDWENASQITGYSKWIDKQPKHIKEKFSKPHKQGITAEDMLYSFEHIDDINKIIKKLKITYNSL